VVEVKNGTLGTIESIRAHAMSVRLDDGRQVAFDTREYNHLDHGYAGTVHKGQGITVDRAYVLASQLYDRHATYVGLSRQRWHAELHWSREQFEDAKQMAAQLSRARPKDMALDYEQAERSNQKLAKEVDHGSMERGRFGVRDPTLGREPGPAGERNRAGLEREPRAHGEGPEHGGSDYARCLREALRVYRALQCEPKDFGEHRKGGRGVDQEYRSEGLRAPGERDSGVPKGKPCVHLENGSPGHSRGYRVQHGDDRPASLGEPAERAARPEHSQGRGVRDLREREAGRAARAAAPSRVPAAAADREQRALGPSSQRLAELARRAELRAQQRQAQQEHRRQIEREVAASPPAAVQLRAPEVLKQWQERLKTPEWTEVVAGEAQRVEALFTRLEAAYDKAAREHAEAKKRWTPAREQAPLKTAEAEAREQLREAYQALARSYQKAGKHVRGGVTTAEREWERLPEVREVAKGLADAHRKLCDAHQVYADWDKTHRAQASWGIRPDREVAAARQQYREAQERAQKARGDKGLQEQACKRAEKFNAEHHIARFYRKGLCSLHERATKGLERIRQHQHGREQQRDERQHEMSLGLSR